MLYIILPSFILIYLKQTWQLTQTISWPSLLSFRLVLCLITHFGRGCLLLSPSFLFSYFLNYSLNPGKSLFPRDHVTPLILDVTLSVGLFLALPFSCIPFLLYFLFLLYLNFTHNIITGSCVVFFLLHNKITTGLLTNHTFIVQFPWVDVWTI